MVSYNGEVLIVGRHETDQVPLAADVYYRGQLLAFNAVTAKYEDLNANQGTLAGIYLGISDAAHETLEDGDIRTIITGGQVNERGLLDNTGAVRTVTVANRAAWNLLGFYVKR
jgi:hypothetical protein